VTKSCIVKPDISAAKATFQLKHNAFQFIPKITLCRPPKVDMLLIRFTNPLEHAVSFTVSQWFRPGDKDKAKPYLFPVPDISTTVGAKEDWLVADKPKPLREDDDTARIHSRTTNSVVVRIFATEPVTSSLVQARLRVTVRLDEPDLESITFHALVSVPLSECK